MAVIVPPSHEKKRVKVYELKSNDWYDRGTGFCMGRSEDVRELVPAPGLKSHEEENLVRSLKATGD